MGRMLEALKRTDEPKLADDSRVASVTTQSESDEADEVEMPFVEVGGPRKSAETSARLDNTGAGKHNSPGPRLEMPAPRPTALHARLPQAVTFQPTLSSPSVHGRVAAELVAFHQPQHPVSNQYAALFAQLMEPACDDSSPVFLFTALAGGAGVTTSTLNLAIAGCRQHRKRLVVVDANNIQTAAAARLGLTPAATVYDVLRGKIALEQALEQTPIDNLYMISTKHRSALSAATPGCDGRNETGTDAFRWVLAWLRQRFDAVLVDAPAWPEIGELSALLCTVTAIYLVVDASESETPAVRTVNREAARLGSRLGGLIVTG